MSQFTSEHASMMCCRRHLQGFQSVQRAGSRRGGKRAFLRVVVVVWWSITLGDIQRGHVQLYVHLSLHLSLLGELCDRSTHLRASSPGVAAQPLACVVE